MATPIAAPGPAVTSPLRDLQVALEERATLVSGLLGGLDQSISAMTEERDGVRRALAHAEEARVRVLEHHHLVRNDLLAAAMRASGDLYVRLRLLEARIAGTEERRAGLAAELVQLDRLRELAAGLDADPGLRSANSDDSRILSRRAERQLIRMITEDHEAVAERMVEGPLEDLADLALAVELIGRRISDGPAGDVTAELVECRQASQRALDRMQRLLFQVSPVGLLEEGLVASVRQVAAHLAGEATVRVQVVGQEPRLPPAVASAAFRVVVEAIDNARRHGRTEEVEVVLSFSPRRLHVVVSDGGEGFDVGATEARLGRTRALGIVGMRERVENASGTLDIRSTLGAGTEVRAVFDTTWR